MTLSELLNQTPFDDIAPFIPKYDDCDNSLASYKMHYDLLRSLDREVKETSPIVLVEYSKDEDYLNHLDADILEGIPFEEAAGSEIKKDSDVTVTDAEIAACCLWHTSFFGFTEEQREWHIDNLIDYENNEMYRSYYVRYKAFLPSKKEILEIPAIHKNVSKHMKLHRSYKADKEDRGFKTLYMKRAWRKWKRYEINNIYQKRIKQIGKFLDLLPTNEKAYQLFCVSDYYIQNFRTYVSNVEERKSYLNELISKYGLFDNNTMKEYIICISASEEHPIESTTEISQLISKGLTNKKVEFVFQIDNSLGVNLKIDIMSFR